MGLAEYRRKRRLGRTPEPASGRTSTRGPLRFVVQKHHARRLHYDFRLELDGVLKSWAVPKGPAYDQAEKRLAMRTEDHPLPALRAAGVLCTINTDDPAMFGTDLGQEYELAVAIERDRRPKR